MNRGRARVVLCACLTLLLGCGARTSTLEDELGGGAPEGGSSGALPLGGASGAFHGDTGGTLPGGAGGVFHGGAGGGFPAGAGGVFHGGAGGGFPAGAGGAFGGFAGAMGGFGAIGGEAGAAGTAGGIGQLCALGSTSCDQCVCNACSGTLLNCFSDSGCTAILSCVAITQCQGLSCYSPSACQGVIDKTGGLAGSAMSKVFSLIACTGTSQNACGCN